MRFQDSSAPLTLIVDEATKAAARDGFVGALLDPEAG